MSQSTVTVSPEEFLVERKQVGYLGTDILTLPAAIRARHEGISREEFLRRQIEQTLELDIDQLELHFDADLFHPGVSELTVKKLGEYRQEMVFSLHLPFRYLDVSCPMERIRSASVETVLDAIELAAELQPINYVLHLTRRLPSRQMKRIELMFHDGCKKPKTFWKKLLLVHALTEENTHAE